MPVDSLATVDIGTGVLIFDKLLPQWGFVIVVIGVWLLNKLKAIDALPTPIFIWALCQGAAFAVRGIVAPELDILATTTAGSALAGNTWFLARILNLGKKSNGGTTATGG